MPPPVVRALLLERGDDLRRKPEDDAAQIGFDQLAHGLEPHGRDRLVLASRVRAAPVQNAVVAVVLEVDDAVVAEDGTGPLCVRDADVFGRYDDLDRLTAAVASVERDHEGGVVAGLRNRADCVRHVRVPAANLQEVLDRDFAVEVVVGPRVPVARPDRVDADRNRGDDRRANHDPHCVECEIGKPPHFFTILPRVIGVEVEISARTVIFYNINA